MRAGLRRAAVHAPLQAVAHRGRGGVEASLTGDSRGPCVGSRASRMRRPSAHVRASLPLGYPSGPAAQNSSQVRRERGRDSAQHEPVPQPGFLTRSYILDGPSTRLIFRRSPPRERLLPARSCARAARDRWGGVLCRPRSQFRSAQKRNPGRERPRLSSAMQRRICPEGSFTSWVPRVVAGVNVGCLHGAKRVANRHGRTPGSHVFGAIKMTQFAVDMCGRCSGRKV
jgi:hypothetical protein